MDKFYWDFLNKSRNIYWKGISNKDRNVAIYEIEKVANQYGYITDFHMFSDLEINIKIETTEQKIAGLYTDLKNYLTLNEILIIDSDSDSEIPVFLNITFIKGTGNLKIEVPSVPG
jgi:hypothetical protein